MTEPTRLPKRLRTRDADQRRTDADTWWRELPSRDVDAEPRFRPHSEQWTDWGWPEGHR